MSDLPAGASFNDDGPGSGVFTWTPNDAQAGVYQLSVGAGGPSGGDIVFITITVNQPPIQLDGVPASATIYGLSPYSFTVVANDGSNPGSTVTFGLQNAPLGASIDPSSGVFSWTPSNAQAGVYSFNVTATDGINTVRYPIKIHVNVGLVLSGVPASASINVSSAYTFTAVGTDNTPSHGPMAYSLNGAPDGASIDPSSGVFAWTPSNAQAGVYSFNVTATDGIATVSAPITINVNAPPVLVGVPSSGTTDVSVPYLFVAASGDSQTLTFGLQGAPSGASVDPSSGVFAWTPGVNQTGDYTFNVTATDGITTVYAPITIHVNPQPVLVLFGVHSDTTDVSIAYIFNAISKDGQKLTFGLQGAPFGASIDPLSGYFMWIPGNSQTGDYTFNVTGSDGVETVSAPITIHVKWQPMLSGVPRSASINVTSTYTFRAVATDWSVPPALTFGLHGAPAGASIDPSSGVFTWTPGVNQIGNYSFSVTLSDGIATVYAPITIQVVEVSSPPVLSCVPSSVNMVTGVKLAFTAAATDSSIPARTLTFSLVGAPSGASIDPVSGAFSWTPCCNQTGNYTFGVVVTDNGGKYDPVNGNLSARSNVTVKVGYPPVVVACGPLLPFNSSTVGHVPIYYLLYGVNNGNVTVSIVNKSGAVVRSLPATGVENSGIYSMVWDGRSDSGAFVPEGYYYVNVVLSMPALLGTTVSAPPCPFLVDNTPPVINISSPVNGGTYTIGQSVYACWNASDSLSFVVSASGTVDNGKLIDASSVGTKSFTVTARDVAGNTATKTVVYTVQNKRKTNH